MEEVRLSEISERQALLSFIAPLPFYGLDEFLTNKRSTKPRRVDLTFVFFHLPTEESPRLSPRQIVQVNRFQVIMLGDFVFV